MDETAPIDWNQCWDDAPTLEIIRALGVLSNVLGGVEAMVCEAAAERMCDLVAMPNPNVQPSEKPQKA